VPEVAFAHSLYLYGGSSLANMSIRSQMHQFGPFEITPVGIAVVIDDMITGAKPLRCYCCNDDGSGDFLQVSAMCSHFRWRNSSIYVEIEY